MDGLSLSQHICLFYIQFADTTLLYFSADAIEIRRFNIKTFHKQFVIKCSPRTYQARNWRVHCQRVFPTNDAPLSWAPKWVLTMTTLWKPKQDKTMTKTNPGNEPFCLASPTPTKGLVHDVEGPPSIICLTHRG